MLSISSVSGVRFSGKIEVEERQNERDFLEEGTCCADWERIEPESLLHERRSESEYFFLLEESYSAERSGEERED